MEEGVFSENVSPPPLLCIFFFSSFSFLIAFFSFYILIIIVANSILKFTDKDMWYHRTVAVQNGMYQFFYFF